MSTLLHLPEPASDTRFPFWHRIDPVVAVTEGFATRDELTAMVGAPAATTLTELKNQLDALNALRGDRGPDHVATRLETELLITIAGTCAQLADHAQERHPEFAAQCRAYSASIEGLVTGQTWQPVTLPPPSEGMPWIYCGPLMSWYWVRSDPQPLSLIVAVHDPVRQAPMDEVSSRWPEALDAVGHYAECPVKYPRPMPPMTSMRLLLVGGEPSRGHKHFAHFVPLELPGVREDNDEYTVTFANFQQLRLQRCSIPLLRAVADVAPEVEQRLLDPSLSWFRSHDLSHSIRLDDGSTDEQDTTDLDPFDAAALEELYADTFGFVSACALADPADRRALITAFTAELLRYLARNPRNFVDSSAAMIEYGWLAAHDLEPARLVEADPEVVMATLARLGRTAQRALWGNGPKVEMDREGISDAAARGLHELRGLEKVFEAVPTELEFVLADTADPASTNVPAQ